MSATLAVWLSELEPGWSIEIVFIGAGGGALPLLQMSGIPEAENYAGFPVGGLFLINENTDVGLQHLAKAYDKASVGSPPMSVPHLDTRILGGKRLILLGPSRPSRRSSSRRALTSIC